MKNRVKPNNIITILALFFIYYIYKNFDKFLLVVVVVGLIIFAIYCFTNNKPMTQSIEQIDIMTGDDFEKYLVKLYKTKGYKVTHVGCTGDYGADVIACKENQKIIIQAKRYSYTVGVKAIQEVISAREFYKGTHAIVITNNYFTQNAKTLATRCNVTLIDRNKLIKLQK